MSLRVQLKMVEEGAVAHHLGNTMNTAPAGPLPGSGWASNRETGIRDAYFLHCVTCMHTRPRHDDVPFYRRGITDDQLRRRNRVR